MKMGSMNGTNESNMDSNMSMTFSSWHDYQVQILFVGWNIKTPLEFAMSWFAAALAVMFSVDI